MADGKFDRDMGNFSLRDLFNNLFEDPFTTLFEGKEMNVDLFDMGDYILVEAELPGYSPEQIHIDILEQGLKITAENNEENTTVDDNNHFFQQEMKSSYISSVVHIPIALTKDNIHTDFKNDMLEIKIAKK